MKTSEPLSQDGYAMLRVPVRDIKFLDRAALESSIFTGRYQALYAHYCDMIRLGHFANGVPIVYRTPKGNLIASDLRHSDIVLYAEQHGKVHPAVARDVVNPRMPVKVIEVGSRDDITVQRALYLEKAK
jgi:hypothetical protein